MTTAARIILPLLLLAFVSAAQAPRPASVLWVTIGGSDDTRPDRNAIGWGIAEKGWTGFVKEVLRPAIDKHGCRRVLLHLPAGRRGAGDFQLDELVHARDAGKRLAFVHADFVAAIRPLTNPPPGVEPVEVIAYLGMMRGDPDFDQYLTYEDARPRIQASIGLYLAAGCSIGLDSAAGEMPGSFTDRLCDDLEARGTRVYVEAMPSVTATKMWRRNVIAVAYADGSGLFRSDPQKFPDSAHYAPRHVLTGEIIGFVRPDGQTLEQQRERRDELRRAGFTPAVERVELLAN